MIYEDHRFDAIRSVRTRRMLVVLGYLMLGAAAVFAWIEATWIAPLSFLLGIIVYFVLRRALRNTDDAPNEALDERLISARDSAFRRAYVALSSAGIASIMGLVLYSGAGGDVGPRQLEALFFAFALGAVLTPTAIRAWEEPEV